MPRVCQVTGKKPLNGFSVSHANNKTKRKFLPNLRYKRFFVPEENGWVTLRVTANGIRTINKRGIAAVLKELRANGEKIKFETAE